MDLPSGEKRQVELTANHRGRHSFGLAPAGRRGEVRAKVFELGHFAREQGDVIRINKGLTADLVTDDQGDLNVTELDEERLFIESDNERLVNLFKWVEK